MSHNTLINYYKIIFTLAQHYHYQISEIENIFPYERDIYLQLLQQHIEEQEKQAGSSF